MRAVTAHLLVVLFALPAILPAEGSSPTGTVKGLLTLNGQPHTGANVFLVDVKSGAIQRLKSGDRGLFETKVAPGDYVVATGSESGAAVGQAPTRISVQAGRSVSLRLDMVPAPSALPLGPLGQTAAATTSSTAPANGRVTLRPLDEGRRAEGESDAIFGSHAKCLRQKPNGECCCEHNSPKCCKASSPHACDTDDE